MGDTKLLSSLGRSDLTQTGRVDKDFKKPVVMPRVSCFAHDGARQIKTITPITPLPATTLLDFPSPLRL